MSGVSIADLVSQCKKYLEKWLLDWGIAVIVILVALISFGVGRLSVAEEQKPVVSMATASTSTKVMHIAGDFVASRNGTAYYFPWCAGVSNISEGNKIWFQTESQAQRAGYHPAKNCKGLADSQ